MPEQAHIHDRRLELYILGRLDEKHVSAIESQVPGCTMCRGRLTESAPLRGRLQ
jgi:hypothetical protein